MLFQITLSDQEAVFLTTKLDTIPLPGAAEKIHALNIQQKLGAADIIEEAPSAEPAQGEDTGGSGSDTGEPTPSPADVADRA
jgi:hypothetical protein